MMLNKIILVSTGVILSFGLDAQGPCSVTHPEIPLVLDREFNIVSELQINGDVYRRLDSLVLNVSDIDPGAVEKVSLVYTGETSMLGSGTTSFVLGDRIKRMGGGQTVYCHPDFCLEVCSAKQTSGQIALPAEFGLRPGNNCFYISLQVSSALIGSISSPFDVNIEGVFLDGGNRVEGDSSACHRAGISVRQAGDDGVCAYRIPGIVTACDGTLIAAYDIRRYSYLDLQNDIDVGVSRSKDGGRTWLPMQVVIDMGNHGGLPAAQNGVGDPCILVDNTTGEIFILALWTHGIGGKRAWTGVGSGLSPEETGQLVMVSSRDSGESWSEPRIITSQVKSPEWFLTLQGPGRGICTSDGTLVFPFQYIGADRVPCAGIIYSKDHGKNWVFHSAAMGNVTESQVAELPDGSLLLSMRNNLKTGRAFSVTKDLGRTWEEYPSSGHLVEPVCMAGLLFVPASRNVLAKDILLFSNPAVKKGRNHITIKASLDLGLSWEEENSVLLDQEEGWGYSCLTMIDDETVGILYESSVSQILFQAVKLRDIVSEH